MCVPMEAIQVGLLQIRYAVVLVLLPLLARAVPVLAFAQVSNGIA